MKYYSRYYSIDFHGKVREIKKSRFVSIIYREAQNDMCIWYNDGENVFIGFTGLDVKQVVAAIIKTTKTFSLENVEIGVSDKEFTIFVKADEFTHGGSDNITIISDKYNKTKTWLVKRSKSRHYYLNQVLNGKMSKWVRCGKKYINNVLNGCLA